MKNEGECFKISAPQIMQAGLPVSLSIHRTLASLHVGRSAHNHAEPKSGFRTFFRHVIKRTTCCANLG